jgi:hypothetical protein
MAGKKPLSLIILEKYFKKKIKNEDKKK